MDLLSGIIVGILGFTFIGFSIICYIILVIGRWVMFEKMGTAGWKSIIPFYSTYVEYSHTWDGKMWIFSDGFLAIGNLITNSQPSGMSAVIASVLILISSVCKIIGFYRLSKAFGKSGLYTLLLCISQPIFTAVLGFGSSTYVGNVYKYEKRF